MNNLIRQHTVFISPQQLLAEQQSNQDIRLIDLSPADVYLSGHVPGALNLDEKRVVATDKPVGGLLPDDPDLSCLFSELGITPNTRVIAYDDQGNSRAGRLLWTLGVIGHTNSAILDGGLGFWVDAGQTPSTDSQLAPEPSDYQVQSEPHTVADKTWILDHLQDPQVLILDVRTPEEYRGEDVRSLRGGHIPGAVNYNWLLSQDPAQHRRLRPVSELLHDLEALGVKQELQIVAYCQTHMRSSHTFNVLRHLGFENLRGYPGAWSDWGNDPSTPIEK